MFRIFQEFHTSGYGAILVPGHSVAPVFLIFPRVLYDLRGRFCVLVNPAYSIHLARDITVSLAIVIECRSRRSNFLRHK